MLRFVLQKIKNKKWMMISLLLGNLLMVSIASAAPMYSQAAMQRALTQNLGNYLVQNNQNPGTIILKGEYQGSAKNAKEVYQNLKQGEQLFDELNTELEVPQQYRITQYYKDSVLAKPEISIDGEKDTKNIKIAAFSDLENHIEIVNGEMFAKEPDGNTIDVIVNERTFVYHKLVIGQVMELTRVTDNAGNPYRLRVVGVFRSNQQQDPYWVSSPSIWYTTYLMDDGIFQKLFVDSERLDTSFKAEWYSVLDYTQMRGDQVERYLAVLGRYQEAIEQLDMESSNYFQSTLEKFVPEYQKLNTTIIVLLLPIFVLLAAFIFMVSRQMLEMEQNEIAIYKSRGSNKKQILQIYLLQSLCITVVSLVVGVPMGMLICNLLGASNSFLEFVSRTSLQVEMGINVWLVAGLAAMFSIGTMVIPAFRYASVNIVDHKRQKNRKNKQPWWQLFFMDFVLLGVAVYGLYQYNQQKDYLAQRVLEGASLDPLLYICSSLFMIGSALLILRLFPLLMRFVFWAGKKFWSPAMYTSFLRVIRTKSNQGFLMVFLMLTVAMGIFNAQAARTINVNAQERIQYATGADLVIEEAWAEYNPADLGLEGEITYIEPDFGKYLVMDEIETVTKVLVNEKTMVSVDGGRLENVMLMGIHTKEFGQAAWFKDALYSKHQFNYLNDMSQNAQAILVSSNFRDIYGYKLGDALYYSDGEHESIRGTIYGFVDYWPSYAPVTLTKNEEGTYEEKNNFLVVANLSLLQSQWGVQQYQVWIDVKGSTQFIYDFLEETGINCKVFEDSAAQIISVKNDPVFQGTNGILTIGFICILMLCSIGFLIYWILSIQSRTLQFGIFRAMGMSMREIFTMLVNEQVFITGVSLGAGILVGILTAKLFIPLIQIAYSAADQVIPLEIISESSDYVRLFAVIGAVILICMMILGALISKIKIAQALKLGED